MCRAPHHPWPEGWVSLTPEQGPVFVQQLRRELGAGHPLAPLIAARRVRAVATAAGSDDVLYRLRGWHAPFAVVHLAWPAPDRRSWLMRRLRPWARWTPAAVPVARLEDLAG